jgi:hypothetical protein
MDREQAAAAAPSDTLTWELARRVMSDHEHDMLSPAGICRGCGGTWPCEAWQRAEDISRQLRAW